jgi:hypothetical protein
MNIKKLHGALLKSHILSKENKKTEKCSSGKQRIDARNKDNNLDRKI